MGVLVQEREMPKRRGGQETLQVLRVTRTGLPGIERVTAAARYWQNARQSVPGRRPEAEPNAQRHEWSLVEAWIRSLHM